jgi:hypothetical protein
VSRPVIDERWWEPVRIATFELLTNVTRGYLLPLIPSLA